MAQDIQATIIQDNIEADVIRQNIEGNIERPEIQAEVNRQDIEAVIEREDVEARIFGAIVNYNGPPLIDNHEVIILNALQITNKYITLAQTPVGNVELDIEGANPQVETRSWNLSGSIIGWSGTDLDGLLEEGDVLSIKYKYQ